MRWNEVSKYVRESGEKMTVIGRSKTDLKIVEWEKLKRWEEKKQVRRGKTAGRELDSQVKGTKWGW